MVGVPCQQGCIWCQWFYQMVELAMSCELLFPAVTFFASKIDFRWISNHWFAVVVFCSQQPGVQMPQPRPRRVDRNNGPSGPGRAGNSSDDGNRGRRYRPY